MHLSQPDLSISEAAHYILYASDAHESWCVLNSTLVVSSASARPQCAVALMAGKMSKRVQCSAATAASEIYDRISGGDHLFPRRRLLRWTRRASASMMGKWHPLFLYTPMVLMMMPGARILIKKQIFENALLHHDSLLPK